MRWTLPLPALRESSRCAPSTWAVGSLCLACLVALGVTVAPASAQQALTHLAEVQGTVYASAIVGNTLYLGGSITAAGFRAPYAAPVALTSGVTAPRAPRFEGASAPQVNVVIPDGNGGWFVGGSFDTVDGVSHPNLVHIDATLHASAWSPPAPDAPVYALATDGTTLYVGGVFTHMGAAARGLGAAVSVSTGQLLAWNPQSNGLIQALLIAPNGVYAGGTFSAIGGLTRSQLALLDASTGAASAFNAQATTPGGFVQTLALDGTTLYVGGFFASMGGAARASAAAFRTTTGTLVGAWRPNPDNLVYAIQPTAAGVFVAGYFSTIGGASRTGLAQVNKSNGNVTTWNPAANQGVTSLALAGNTLYAAGDFASIGGQPREGLAALDATTAAATAWHPAPATTVFSLAVGSGYVYAGGAFQDLGGMRARQNLAAIDLPSGNVLDFGPSANDSHVLSAAVRSMCVANNKLYVGGDFTQVNGAPRVGLAAFDLATSALLPFAPNPDGSVQGLVALGSQLYLGGFFNNVGATPRAHLAAVDLASGALSSWDPGANSLVYALTTDGTHVFAGGTFSVAAGVARSCVASLDASTGTAAPWSLALSGAFRQGGQFVPPAVYSLSRSGTEIYVGGSFIAPNGWWCGVGANANSAATGPWLPFIGFFEAGVSQVHAARRMGSMVYTGGHSIPFSAFDLQTNNLSPWSPPQDWVESLSGSDHLLVVGWTNGGIAVYADPAALDTPLPRPGGPLALAPISPNPLRHAGVLRFTLPTAEQVELGLFDVSGRLVRSLASGQTLSAGPHEFSLSAEGLAPGVYLARLYAAGETRVSRLVVAR